MNLYRYRRFIVAAICAVSLFTGPASSFAQVKSGDGFSVNYSGRNAVQAFIQHGSQYLDGVVEVSAGDEIFFTRTYSHRETGPFKAPHPVSSEGTVKLAAPFFDTLLMDGLPNGRELTFTFRYQAAPFLLNGELFNPESIEKSMTGTLAHVEGELRTQEEDYTVTWEGGEVLLDGRLIVHEGVTLEIKDAVVKSLEPDSSLSRAEILMVGGHLNATNTLFENLDEISLQRQDDEKFPLCLMQNCVFRNDTFIFEVRNSGYSIGWDNLKEDHSANYDIQILTENDPLPSEGTGLLVLRLTGDLSSNTSTELHVRVFDPLGNIVADASEEDLRFNPTFFKGNLRFRVNNGTHTNLDDRTRRELADTAFGFAGLEFGEGIEIISRHTNTAFIIQESQMPNTEVRVQSEGQARGNISKSFIDEIYIGDPNNDPTKNFHVKESLATHIEIYGSENSLRNNTLKTKFALGMSGTGESTGIRVGTLSNSSDIQDSSANRISQNHVSGYTRGIELRFANNNIISDNIVELNRSNLVFHGQTSGGENKPLSGNQIFNNIFRAPQDFDTGREIIPGVNFEPDGHCEQNACNNQFQSQEPAPLKNIVGGPTIGGNFWDDSFGADANSDGFEDEPHLLHVIPRYEDLLPLFFIQQASLVVNTATDESDADPNDNVADVDLNTPGLQTSLRSAIEFANASDERIQIGFDIQDGQTIELLRDLVLSSSVDINGGEQTVSTGEGSEFRISAGADNSSIKSLRMDSGTLVVAEARGLDIKSNHFQQVRIESNGSAAFDGNDIDQLIIVDSAGCAIGGEAARNELGSIRVAGAASRETSIIGNSIEKLELENVPEAIVQDNTFTDTVGIELKGAGTTGTLIESNNFQCGVGILISDDSSQNMIGGTEPGQRNTFFQMASPAAPFIPGRQVGVGIASGIRNKVVGNVLDVDFSGMIVDLDFDIVNPADPTANDDDKAGGDGLPNRLINKPEIVLLSLNGNAGGGVEAIGFVESLPGTDYTIEFLSKRNEPGVRSQFTSDSNGLGVFSVPLSSIQDPVAALVTDADGNTSEPSEVFIQFIVNSSGDAEDANPGDGLNLTGNTLENGAPEATLRAAFQEIEILDDTGGQTIQIIFQLPENNQAIPQIQPQSVLSLTTPNNIKIGGVNISQDVRSALVASGVPENILNVNAQVELFGINLNNDFVIDFNARSLKLENMIFNRFAGNGARIHVSQFAEISHCQFLLASRNALVLREATGDNAIQNPQNISSDRFFIHDNFFGVSREGEVFNNRIGLFIDGVSRGRVQNNIFGGNFTGAELVNVKDTVMVGNRFGIFSDGTPIANGSVIGDTRIGGGLVIRGTSEKIHIGGLASDDENLFSANAEFGINIVDTQGEQPIRIAGNKFVDERVGVLLQNKPGGTAAHLAGNRFESGGIGVLIQGGAAHQVGGSELLPFPNIFNANDVCVRVVEGINNHISENSMFGNLAGIELLEGANNSIKPPVLRSVIHDGSQLDIKLAITAEELQFGTDYIVEFFKSRRIDQNSLINPRDRNCDQGRTFIGARTFSLNEDKQHFVSTLLDLSPDLIGDEDNISATVTVSGRGTSEFSNCFAFVPNDANGDGVPDVLEENVSGDGDFNDNGVPDIDETLVTAVQTFSINGELGAVLPIAVAPQQPDNEVKIRQIKGIPVEFAQIAPPAGINFPLGLIVIELEVDQPGGSATFSLPIPEGFEDKINCYYKLVQQPLTGILEWICYDEFLNIVDSQNISVTLTDGELGDLDLITDKLIRDPGGPAFDPSLEPVGDFEVSIVLESSTLRIIFPAQADKHYTLLRSSDLTDFTPLQDAEISEINPETGTAFFTIELTDPLSLESEFFRVLEELQ